MPNNKDAINFRHRLSAAARVAWRHLLFSGVVALAVAALVLGLWYPFPYRQLSGGLELFWLVVAVDLACGPLLTLVLFSPYKRRAELMRDLGLVALIQLAVLLYGLWVAALARPVWLVFEADRFRVVSAAEISPGDLPEALPELRRPSMSGPRIIAARIARPGDEDFLHSLSLSMQGLHPALRPGAWRLYAEFRSDVLAKAQPLVALGKRYPERGKDIEETARRSGAATDNIGYLPVQGRHDLSWIALVAMDDARVIGFLPLDGF